MEFVEDIDYWRSKALEQQLRAVQAELQMAKAGLQANADELYAKYGLTKGVDRMEERDGKYVIIRAPKTDEAVK